MYRKAVAWVSTFSSHPNSSKFSDVSFEWRREEGRDGGEKSCTDIPSYKRLQMALPPEVSPSSEPLLSEMSLRLDSLFPP